LVLARDALELFALACEPLDLLRAPVALPFEALAPFVALELPDAREDLADEDFR